MLISTCEENIQSQGKNHPKELEVTVFDTHWSKNSVIPFGQIGIMAPGPNTSWQIDEETMETLTDFVFLGSKITADGDCSHEIKRRLLLGRKAMTSLDSVLKSRYITMPAKVHIVKATVFPVVMYGSESWTKRRLNAKKLMLSNRVAGEDSRVPWMARKSN